MADHHAPLQQAVFQHTGAGLAHHLPDGQPGHGEVIRRGGQRVRQCVVGVFQVGQVDIHLALQLPQGLHRLVAAAVIHHGDTQLRLQRRQDPRQEMGGGHQIDIVGALGDERLEDLPQVRRGDGLAVASGGDGAILAVGAPEGAAGEEHRSAAVCAGDGRLLPHMQGGAGHANTRGHAAKAAAFLLRPLRAAAAGTQRADHFRSRWKSGPRSPAIQWRRHSPMYWSLAPSTTCSPSFSTWP